MNYGLREESMWKHKAFSTDDFPAILSMAQEQYGLDNDIANEDFLRYQYFKNPAGDALIDLAVDVQDGALAGQYVVWPMRFLIHGQLRQSSNSLNTLTGKKYRGQGIFTGLAEETYRREEELGHAFCYGMPNPNSYPGFIKKLNFKELGQIPLLLRPLRPSQMVEEFLHSKVLSVFGKPTDPFFRIKESVKEGALEILPVTKERLELVDEFWNAVKGKYPVMNIRDGAFVRFRYLDMPRRTYFPYLAVEHGRPVCFAVGRTMEVAGMQCAMLADFLFADGYAEAAERLLRKLLHEMQNQGASLAGCLMFGHTQESAVLKKLGFFRCPKRFEPQPFPLILRLFDQSLEEKGVCDVKNWFFTMGDYDVI